MAIVDAAHIGRKVTVIDHVLLRSKTEEAKFADCDKREAEAKPLPIFKLPA
jgi:hypothetical protein